MSKHTDHHTHSEAAPEEVQGEGAPGGPGSAGENGARSPERGAGEEGTEKGGAAKEAAADGSGGDASLPGDAPLEKRPGEFQLDRITELEAKLAETNDLYLRKAADFENFRKRMTQEKQGAIDFANQALLLDLIPIIDDLERALKAAENSLGREGDAPGAGDFKGLYEGIGMIEKRLVSQLENRWGLKRFDSGGEPFDPNRHEAIMMEKSPEISEPVVKEDFMKGYTLKERVIRPAKVRVIMPESGGTGN
jgi:molecular chaperone GrpE